MIKILCVGKIKEKYLNDLINDYKTRITKYHKIEIIELKDSNITNESNIINTYYIPEINKGILKYKDLDDDMKEEVFKSI